MWEHSPRLSFNLLQFRHPSALQEGLLKKGRNSCYEGPNSRLVDKSPPPPLPSLPTSFLFLMSCSFPVKWIITVGIILVTWHYLDEVNNWNLCLKGFYLVERKRSAGRVGRKERKGTHTHVCITFMCTWACQTSHCVRLGTPVMLTDSDSPRPDQQALAHCTVQGLFCGKGAQLRGQNHSLCHHPDQRGRSGPAVRCWRERKKWWKRLCECVFYSWLVYQLLPAATVASGAALCSFSHWLASSLSITPPTPTVHSLVPRSPPASCRRLPGFVLSPCSDTLCSPSISSSHSVLIAFKSTQTHHNNSYVCKHFWSNDKKTGSDVDPGKTWPW